MHPEISTTGSGVGRASDIMHELPEIQVYGNGHTLTLYGKESLTQGYRL
jgi:hypothetical protein